MSLSDQDEDEVQSVISKSFGVLIKALKLEEQKRIWRAFENELDTKESQDDGDKVR